jgi:predicted anti-sigma-YlaC factor YlaD
LLTCKDFLRELNDYLDECCDKSLRAEIEKHLSDCPNCFVVADTTRRTVSVYKGMTAQPLSDGLKSKLMGIIESRIKARGGTCCGSEKKAESGKDN